MLPHLLYVIWAISLICVPVGPHASLLVAIRRAYQLDLITREQVLYLSLIVSLTIANFDLDLRIALGHVLDAAYHRLRHVGRASE